MINRKNNTMQHGKLCVVCHGKDVMNSNGQRETHSVTHDT